MKRFATLLLSAVLLPGALFAQSFRVGVMPRTQTSGGSPVTYSIHAMATGGYTASVYISATCPTLPLATLQLSGTYINSPYSDSVTLTVTLTGPKTGGSHDIYIIGSNGPLRDTAIASIVIPLKLAWHVYDTSSSAIPDNNINLLRMTPGGVGWIQTSKGLATFDGSTWTTIKGLGSRERDSSVHAYGIASDQRGDVWVAVRGGPVGTGGGDTMNLVLWRDSLGTWSWYGADTTVPTAAWARDIACDANGKVWIASSNGLYSFDGSKWKYYDASTVNAYANSMLQLAVDGRGHVWVRCLELPTLLLEFDGTFWTSHDLGIFGNGSSVMAMPDGSIWYTGRRGIEVFGPAGDSVYQAMDSMPSGQVVNVFPGPSPAYGAVDAQHDTLVTFDAYPQSDAGLMKFYSGGPDAYTISNSGLPCTSHDVDWIAPGPNNTFWIATNSSGLVIYDATQSGYDRPATGNGTDWDSLAIQSEVGGSVSGTVVLSAVGNGALVVTGLAVTGADSTQFSIDYAGSLPFKADPARGSWSMPSGSSEYLMVRFHPSSPGKKSADLKLFTTSDPQGSVIAHLGGTGVTTAVREGGLVPEGTMVLHSYPDPVRDRVTLQVAGVAAGPGRVTVMDLLGRTIWDAPMLFDASGVTTLDVAALGVRAGVWAVRVSAGGHTANTRLVVTGE